MENKIYVGDSYEVLTKLPSNFFQLMVTSPPYWNEGTMVIRNKLVFTIPSMNT